MSAKLIKLDLNGHAVSNADIAAHLREVIERIESGEVGNVQNAVLLIESDNGELHRNACGQYLDTARMIGLLTIAAVREGI